MKEIELLPDNAVVRYTVPMPDNSLIPGKKVQEIPLNGSVVSTVNGSPPKCTVEQNRLRALARKPVILGVAFTHGRCESMPMDHRKSD